MENLEPSKAKILWKNQTDIDIETLESARTSKLEELSNQCTQAIITGRVPFEIEGQTLTFSTDLEAQINLNGTANLFTKGLIEEVEWTARDSEGIEHRVKLDSDTFDELSLVIFDSINGKIAYLNTLRPLVRSAKTIEEIQAITWDWE